MQRDCQYVVINATMCRWSQVICRASVYRHYLWRYFTISFKFLNLYLKCIFVCVDSNVFAKNCTKLAIFANISTFYHKQIVYICQLDPIQFQTHSRLITGRLHLIGLKSPWRPQLTVSSCRLVLQRNHFRGNETETATFLHIAAIILVLPKSATIVFP